MTDLKNRRPLDSRGTAWARQITQMLAARNVTPNQISQASMVSALISGAAFWATAGFESGLVTAGLLIVAALGCQVRLLCNLFDGMVAIEAGKSAPDGPFWNEFPDRVSDILIFVGVGLGTGSLALGFAVATLSVLAAYTRELGASIGLPPDFRGPMAKQHRMALITGAAILSVFEPLVLAQGVILTFALWIILLGTVATVFLRARAIQKSLLAR